MVTIVEVTMPPPAPVAVAPTAPPPFPSQSSTPPPAPLVDGLVHDLVDEWCRHAPPRANNGARADDDRLVGGECGTAAPAPAIVRRCRRPPAAATTTLAAGRRHIVSACLSSAPLLRVDIVLIVPTSRPSSIFFA